MADIEALKKLIEDSGMKMTAIAEKSGIPRGRLYARLDGIGEFTGAEIIGLQKALNMTVSVRRSIFGI